MSDTNPTTPAIETPENWTDQERWVYSQLLKGEIACLNWRKNVFRDPKECVKYSKQLRWVVAGRADNIATLSKRYPDKRAI
jgi:hypothetical protein